MSTTNPSRRPINQETREQIRASILEGTKGRNAIAREYGVSGATVGNIADEIGFEFDWSTTEAATAARRVQADAIRENLANLFLLEAHRALQDLHAPATIFQFEQGRVESEYDGEGDERRLVRTTTRPGEFREHVLPEPTFSDKRNIMTIAGIAITKAAEVSRPQPGQGAEQGSSVLRGLADAIYALEDGALADVDPTATPDDPEA